MKTILQLFFALGVLVFNSNHAKAAPVSTNEAGLRLTIELRDGSRITGKSLDDPLRLHSSSLGDMKLPVASIRSIEFSTSGETARLTATNGDTFAVQFVASALRVETGFGKTELPVKLIRSIKVSPMIKLGQLPEGLVGMWLDGDDNAGKNIRQCDVIMVPNNADLVSMQQTRQLTFAVWIKPYSIPSEFPVLLMKGSSTQQGANFGGYEFFLNAHGDNDLIFNSGGYQVVTHNANGRWINNHLNEWIHVAFTIDDKTKTAKFYVNGLPTNDEHAFGTSDDLNFDVPSNLYIGVRDPANTPNASRFDGEMRDVMLFNRALSAAEIQDICTEQNNGEPLPPPAPALILMPIHGALP